MALSILINGNIISLDTLSDTFKNGLEEYVKSQYDLETGFFLDRMYADRVLENDHALGGSQGMAVVVLRKSWCKRKRGSIIYTF